VNRAVAAALGASVGGLGLYWWHCRETVPFTGRKHSIMFVSPEMERQMGVQTYQHMKSEAAAQGALLPDNHPAARLVARVGGRLAAVAAEGDGNDSRSSSSSFSSSSSLSSSSSSSKSSAAISHMRGLKWEFAVVDSPQVNAMVAPGGKVIVYTGLLRLVKGNEDELAAVLAHEAAHVLARHHAERMGRANAAAFLNVLARWLLGVPIPGAVVALALVLPHSRANEREADAIGVRLAARACFDPAANVRMLQRLASAEGGGGGGSGGLALLRTHPITSERVEAVRALLPKAMGEYEARCAVARAVLLEDRAYAAATAAPGPLG
jgi:predicted Zn-dependent protease